MARDNTVLLAGRVLQIAAQPGRRSCVGLTVTARHHLDGHYTITRGAQRWGIYGADGQPMDAAAAVDAKRAPTAAWKTPRTRFPPRPQASL